MKVGTDHLMPGCNCLNCGKHLDGASAINDDGMPSPGDITLCIYCGHIMAFADDLSFRELNDEEMHEVAGDKRIIAVQWARAEVKKRSKANDGSTTRRPTGRSRRAT
jgi:hypothetical protein